MKKFYTLLSVALLSAGALSAASHFEKAVKTTLSSTTAQTLTKQMIANVCNGQEIQKAKIKDPNAPVVDPSGIYVAVGFDEEKGQVPGEESVMGSFEVVKNNDAFIVKGLLGTNYDLPATIKSEQVSDGAGGVETVEMLTIPGQGKTPFIEMNGSVYSLYIVGYNEKGQFTAYTNDIQFQIGDNGDLYWPYVGAWFGYANPEGQCGYFENINGFHSNAVMTAVETYTQNNQEVTEDYKYDLAYKMYKGYDDIFLYNFMEAGVATTVVTDAQNATATATDVLIGEYRLSQTSQTTYPFYANSNLDIPEDGKYRISGTLSAVSENTMNWNIGEWYLVNFEQAQAIGHFTKTVVTFDPEDENAGIVDVVVDNDENAPVEYYNLQGVRVANPEAGQLVIKRQGKNVSKEVVR